MADKQSMNLYQVIIQSRKIASWILLGFLFWSLFSMFQSSQNPAQKFISVVFMSPFGAFIFEIIWLLMTKNSARESSIIRLFSLSKTRELDLIFWFFFLGGFTPIWLLTLSRLPIPWLAEKLSISNSSFHLIENQYIAVPIVFLTLSFFDFFAHWLWHRIPILWQFHKLHHRASEMTVLTVYREHLGLSWLTDFIKAFLLLTTGFSLATLGPVLMLSNLLRFLHHSRIQSNWGVLGQLVISPQAHWIHHSIDPNLHNKNFGFDITLWDRIFGTFQHHVADPNDLRIGLK